MKKIPIILIIFPLLTGCAYLHDRGRDVCDIVTVSVETGHANAAVGLPWYTFVGLGYSEGRGFGSRSGALGIYDYSESNLSCVFLGANEREFAPNENDTLRGKGYESNYRWIVLLHGGYSDGYLFGQWHNYGQVELAATLGVGARLGVNCVEFVDFALGLFTVDFLGDDIVMIKKKKREEDQKKSDKSGKRE